MIAFRALRLILVIWCALSDVLHALNPDTNRREGKDLGPLGVTLDFTLATTWPSLFAWKGRQIRRNLAWSSHIRFKGPVSAITDGQLWKMAYDAYSEMLLDMDVYEIIRKPKNQPGAMTILAFDNEVILASSQKGTSFVYEYGDTPARQALQSCQISWNEDRQSDELHTNQGSCGEVMASQMYYSIYSTPLAEKKARVATVTLDRRNNKLGKTPPCGNPEEDTWGCNLFIQSEKIGLIDLDTTIDNESYDLDTLAGGKSSISQIQLCSGTTSS